MGKSNWGWVKHLAIVLVVIFGCRFLFWKIFSGSTVNSIAFSPNGQLVAGAGGWLTPHDGDDLGGALWIWDAQNGAVKQRLTARFSSMKVLRIVAFSEDGSTIAAWQGDGRKFLWDVESGRLLQVKEPASNSFRAAPNTPWTQRAAESSTEVLPYATSPSGNRLLDQSGIEQRSILMSRVERVLANTPQEQLRTISAKSAWMVTYQDSSKGVLRIRDLENGSTTQVLPEELDESYPLKFSPDSKILALQCHGKLNLWDMQHRRLRLTLKSEVVAPKSLAFSPDSKTIVESGGYGDVEVWDIRKGSLLHRWIAN